MKKKNIVLTILGIIIIVLIIGILFVLYDKTSYKYKKEDLYVYFFDAGKADSMIIRKNDKVMMIDTGESNLETKIKWYMNENNIKKIDYLILSHFDKDHIGNAAYVINNYEVGNVLQSNSPKDSEEYTKYLEALESKQIEPITVSGDYAFEMDDCKIVVNGPETTYEKNESNNSSLITRITYNKNTFLFMGDSQNDRTREYLNTNPETADVIKVPYHGHYQKQDITLFEIIKPKYAVISTSKDVIEEKLINLLDTKKINYYSTFNGEINIYSNGEKIVIKQ
ncbi:MAG: MBL fold metallo-hydrolase [Bacilli bacterium]|nr:MBL fold metallo-hydrolase [Bacilli bacterium]